MKKSLSAQLANLNDSQAAIFLGDLHAGGWTSPLPDNLIKTNKGALISPTPLQRKLNTIWGETTKDALASVKRLKFSLILMGDLIEGHHHHNDLEIISPDEGTHAKLAVKMLEPLAKAAHDSGGEVILAKGTPCHVGDFETLIGEQLGAICDPTTEQYAFDEIRTPIFGCLCDFKHHMPTTSRAYLEGGALSIVMGNQTLNDARDGVKIAKLFARAHRHVEGLYSNGRQKIFVTSSYQAKTPHGWKVVGESGTRLGCATAVWKTYSHLPYVDFHSRTLITHEGRIAA